MTAKPSRTDVNGKNRRGFLGIPCLNGTKLVVLMILCLQNSMFTVLRRYSQGILKENYSKHEVLLMGEAMKMVYAAWMISGDLPQGDSITTRLKYLVQTSQKMCVLALLYGLMNILSYISLRNISAGVFTIFAQCKILTTATFSTLILRRRYSATQWRALVALMLGVLLFSEPIWRDDTPPTTDGNNQILGTCAVLIEVILSGFASIYFEKVIKTSGDQLGIWERNFQLALWSFPVYLMFMWNEGGEPEGYGSGWSIVTWMLALLGAAGGLLVALSIKHGDSILKALATTGAIIFSSLLDHVWLGGPLTPTMMLAGAQVVIAICNYTFDATPKVTTPAIEDPRPIMSSADDAEKEGLLEMAEAGSRPATTLVPSK